MKNVGCIVLAASLSLAQSASAGELFLTFQPDRALPEAPTVDGCHADAGLARGTLGPGVPGATCHSGLLGDLAFGVGTPEREIAAGAVATFTSAPLTEALVLLGPGSITVFPEYEPIGFVGFGIRLTPGLGYWLHEVRPDETFAWIGYGQAIDALGTNGVGAGALANRGSFDVGRYTVAAGNRLRIYLFTTAAAVESCERYTGENCPPDPSLLPSTAPVRLLFGGVSWMPNGVAALGAHGIDYGGSGLQLRVQDPAGIQERAADIPAPDVGGDGDSHDEAAADPVGAVEEAGAAEDAPQSAGGGLTLALLAPLGIVALMRRRSWQRGKEC